jgi:hypothetical protein
LVTAPASGWLKSEKLFRVGAHQVLGRCTKAFAFRIEAPIAPVSGLFLSAQPISRWGGTCPDLMHRGNISAVTNSIK